jgi:hypothetical protein
LVDIPRPSIALRYWDVAQGEYVAVDPTLDGAPTTPEAVDEWYRHPHPLIKDSLSLSIFPTPGIFNFFFSFFFSFFLLFFVYNTFLFLLFAFCLFFAHILFT